MLAFILALSLAISPVPGMAAQRLDELTGLSGHTLAPASNAQDGRFKESLSTFAHVVKGFRDIVNTGRAPLKEDIEGLQAELREQLKNPQVRILYDAATKHFYYINEAVPEQEQTVWIFVPREKGIPGYDPVIGFAAITADYEHPQEINTFLAYTFPITEAVRPRVADLAARQDFYPADLNNRIAVGLDELRQDNVPIGGVKGANLGELFQIEDIQVPGGFIVTTLAFRKFLESAPTLKEYIENKLKDVKLEDPVALSKAAADIRNRIKRTEIPPDVKEEIVKWYARMCWMYANTDNSLRVAVRSSVTARDMTKTSFAGQLETDLNVRGVEHVLKSVKKCWASLFTDRIIHYRGKQGVADMQEEISIIVQSMVNSKVSGAAFSLDEKVGWSEPDAGVVSFNVSYGLGEAVVGGKTNPDRFILHFNPVTERWNIVSKERGAKEKMMVYDESRGGTTLVDVPGSLRKEFCITDEMAVRIAESVSAISRHYGRFMDIEFAVDEFNNIWTTEARAETVWSKAPPGVIRLKKLVVPEAAAREKEEDVVVKGSTGSGANFGRAVVIDTDAIEKEALAMAGKEPKDMTPEEKAAYQDTKQQLLAQALNDIRNGDIIVTQMTTPDMVPAMRRAAGVVTDVGGSTSHAAIIARELGLPAVIGAGSATRKIQTGMIVTLDADRGKVFKGKLKIAQEGEDIDIAKLPKTHTRIGLLLAQPEKAREIAAFRNAPGHFGVGLIRAEFALGNIGIHPRTLEAYDYYVAVERAGIKNYNSKQFNELVPDKHIRHAVMQIRDNAALREKVEQMISGYPSGREFFVQKLAMTIAAIAATTKSDQKVIYRLTDLRANEYGNLVGGDLFEAQGDNKEPNPMMGERGTSRLIAPKNRETFGWEIDAIKRARDMGYRNISVMFPMVRTPEDLEKGIEIFAENGLERGKDGFRAGIMIEVPANVFQIDDFLDVGVDFVSFGTNDLTQFMLSVERDNERMIGTYDDTSPAIIRSIMYVSRRCRERGVEVGLCGMLLANNPKMAQKVVPFLDSVGVTPDSYAAAAVAVKEAEEKIGPDEQPKTIPLVPMKTARPDLISVFEISGNRLFLNEIKTHPLMFNEQAKTTYRESIAGYITKNVQELLERRKAEEARPNDMIVYSTTDLSSDAYMTLAGGEEFEKPDQNPLMGFRGMTRHLTEDFEDIFRLELAGIREAREQGCNVGILLKSVRTAPELDRALEIIKEERLEDAPIGIDISIPSFLARIDDIMKRKIDFVTVNRFILAQHVIAADIKNPANQLSFAKADKVLIKPLKIISQGCVRNNIKLGYLYGETVAGAHNVISGWQILANKDVKELERRAAELAAPGTADAEEQAAAIKKQVKAIHSFMSNIQVKRETLPIEDFIPTQESVYSDEMKVRKDEMEIGLFSPILVLRYGPKIKKVFILDGHTRSKLLFTEGKKEIEALVIEVPCKLEDVPKIFPRQYPQTAEKYGLKTIDDIKIEQGSTPLSRLEGYAATQAEDAEEEEEQAPVIELTEDGLPTFIDARHAGYKQQIRSTMALNRHVEREPQSRIYLYDKVGEPQVLGTAESQYVIFFDGYLFFRCKDDIIMFPKSMQQQAKKPSEYPARIAPRAAAPATELAAGTISLDGDIRLKGDHRFAKALGRATAALAREFGGGVTLLVNNVRVVENLSDGDAADPVGYTARRTNRDIEIDSRALAQNEAFLADVLLDEFLDVVGTWTEPDAGIRELAVLLSHRYSSMSLTTAADIARVLEKLEFDPGKQFLSLLTNLWRADERHDTDIRKLVMFVYSAPKYRQVRQLINARFPGIRSEADVPQGLVDEVKRSQEKMMKGIAYLNELAAYARTVASGLKEQGLTDGQIRDRLEKAGLPARGDAYPPYEAVMRSLNMFRIMNDNRDRVLDAA
jgi:pyruvate,water dikinase